MDSTPTDRWSIAKGSALPAEAPSLAIGSQVMESRLESGSSGARSPVLYRVVHMLSDPVSSVQMRCSSAVQAHGILEAFGSRQRC